MTSSLYFITLFSCNSIFYDPLSSSSFLPSLTYISLNFHPLFTTHLNLFRSINHFPFTHSSLFFLSFLKYMFHWWHSFPSPSLFLFSSSLLASSHLFYLKLKYCLISPASSWLLPSPADRGIKGGEAGEGKWDGEKERERVGWLWLSH